MTFREIANDRDDYLTGHFRLVRELSTECTDPLTLASALPV
jgi:hypothetical protein